VQICIDSRKDQELGILNIEAKMAKGLTPEQLSFFRDNGYLILPAELPSAAVSSLVTETTSLLNGFSLENHPMTKFSTGERDPHVGDDYFLTSGDKIRYFFEEDAFGDDGKLSKPKERAINKIGHYLHELNPNFKAVTVNDRNKAIATSLGFRDARCLQAGRLDSALLLSFVM
jgi:phytanoyl-CoA hydroxylase